jgi:tetratricopeptide (TPR) repeat protein
MVSAFDALYWLNRGLSEDDQNEIIKVAKEQLDILAKIKNGPIPMDVVRDAVAAARFERRYPGFNPLTLPEVLLTCAVTIDNYGNKKEYHEANVYSQEAISLYPATDIHRLASAYWILGRLEWAQNNNTSAYQSWLIARKNFLDLLAKSRLAKNIDNERWYAKWVREMTQDMVGTVEDAFSWMYRLGGSVFDSTTRILGAAVVANLNDYNYSQAIPFAQDLVEISRGVARADVKSLTIQALSYYQSGNFLQSIDSLKSALVVVNAFSPEQAIIYWILGLVYWKNKDQVNGSRYCQLAISEFERLEKATSRSKQKAINVIWYRNTAAYMTKIHEEKMKNYTE